MAIQIQGNNGVVAEVDGTTFRALRITSRPLDYGTLGHYSISVSTGSYVALAANAIMFSARWTDATRFAVIYRFTVQVAATVAATAAGFIYRELFFTRGFTVSDSAGTAVTLTGNNAKLRTSMGTSLMGDMRVMAAVGLTIGTGTNDAVPHGKSASSMGTGAITTSHVLQVQSDVDLIQDNGGESHPIVLAQNEGVRLLNNPIGPASASLQSTFDKRWAEVTAF